MSEQDPEPYEEIVPPSQDELDELDGTETDYSDPVDVDPPEQTWDDDEDLDVSDEDDEVPSDNYEPWLPTDDDEIDEFGDHDDEPPEPQPGYEQ